MQATRLFKEFFDSEKAGGVILIICTLVSLLWSNSSVGATYQHFWHINIAQHSLTHWVNDGLMTIFFLLIGLELERELYQGELSNIKDALLPIVGALGGMLVPAGIYMLFNYATAAQDGAGIAMATDIAFALGILSLLGNRVPLTMKVFLTALAVIDDLGAILVIALFYSKSIAWGYLGAAMGIFAVLLILNRLKVHRLLPYLVGGVAMWYALLHSGIHATIAGVLLAFAIPFGDGKEQSVSYILQHILHKPVAFFILPIFALANTAFTIDTSQISNVWTMPHNLGVIAGLVIGKPLGITLFTAAAAAIGICSLSPELNLKQIAGVSILGGIGFTMSIFIALLAFDSDSLINELKLSILIASLLSGIAGYIILRNILPAASEAEN